MAETDLHNASKRAAVAGAGTVTAPAASILYVITDLKLGGVPLHLRRLALAMRDRGFRCEIASLGEAGDVADMLRNDGFAVHDCGGRGRWDWRVFNRLVSLMRGIQPDIVHSLLFHANLASRAAAGVVGFSSGRVIGEIQTVEVERPWHLWVDRWTYHGSLLTICNSPSVVEHLATVGRIPRGKLRLVCGGVDPDELRAAPRVSRAELGVPRNAPIVFWAGRLDRVKGLGHLIDAFAGVARSSVAHLLLAGDGPLRESLGERIERADLASRVHLLGARRDVPSLLRATDVFVFPSLTEGLPNALLEAMACGCPIVTTDVPGCRDLITAGETGLIVPFGDVAALSTAIMRLLDDRGLARQLGARAALAVERDWHIDRMFAGYEGVYREALIGESGG